MSVMGGFFASASLPGLGWSASYIYYRDTQKENKDGRTTLRLLKLLFISGIFHFCSFSYGKVRHGQMAGLMSADVDM